MTKTSMAIRSKGSGQPQARWTGAIVCAVLTLVLLTPLVALWGYTAIDAREHLSERGWRANHELRLQLQYWACVIACLPTAGAFLGRVFAGRSRDGARVAFRAAAGALVGTVGVYVVAVYTIVTLVLTELQFT